jgi:hypothetical protein
MSNISSISELLNLSNSQYRIYDIGRRVNKISKEHFEKIEAAQIPYPFPIQGHAAIAIAFWQKQSATPYLWFVKLPLDERGLLNQGARNHFIAIIIEALGENLTVDPSEQQEALLKKNPYHFTPAQYKLAAINSVISAGLKHQPSRYYASAIDYLSGSNGWENWQQVGVQGLSDVAFRLNEDDNTHILTNALMHLPEQVITPLCSALENVPLPVEIVEQIISTYEHIEKSNTDDLQVLALPLLRALSSSTQHPYCQSFFTTLLQREQLSNDILIIIAGRLWQLLTDDKAMLGYLELLASSEDNDLFVAIFKDLVAIPAIRPLLLQAMRSPTRSNMLVHALGQLFKG